MIAQMPRPWIFILILSVAADSNLFSQTTISNPDLQNFSKEFFVWRARTQPCSGDDIMRVERPDGWVPDFSVATLKLQKEEYIKFSKRLQSLKGSLRTCTDSVDYLLLRSAVERVHWQLDILKEPYLNPDFYCHQTIGALYELLLISSPMTETRIKNIIVRINSFPATIGHAKANLTQPILPFAEIALDNLKDIRKKMNATVDALKKTCDMRFHSDLDQSNIAAINALEEYASWLESKKNGMTKNFSIGREAYLYFLKNIALIPNTPEELLLQGRQEWERSVAFEGFEIQKNSGIPADPIFKTIEDQIEKERLDEESIRKFLEEKNIMTVPSWIKPYWNAPIPDYLKPFTYMGVPDDMTSATRLDEPGYHYIPEPSPDLPFFYLATAKDPRPIIVHEGIPGHYFQMVRSWKNPNSLRQNYFDSDANEGIGFYVEEMLLQFGLFDNKPHTRETIYRFMRLRALRVEVDIQLALGNFSVKQAGDYLARTVPMDRGTAEAEAGFFAYNPGQAITYQIGKLQIHQFLSDARLQLKEKFDLRAFHDYLMINGNVPIALLRWEYLGLDDQIKKLW